jgi:superfamily I DNA and/or RNA helicase
VICLLSHTHGPSLRRDLDFLYNRPRLNVAISRAKTVSIVISSTGVLNPPIEALVDTDNLEGYAYLKAFEDRAWSFDIAVGVQNTFATPPVSEG